MPAQSPSVSRRSQRRHCLFIEPLESRRLLAAAPGHLVGGVDPYNMGKGDWIWQIPSAMVNTGTTTVPELMSYLKDKGLKWIIVKAGDANNGPVTGTWTQFNKTLIDEAHKVGLK